MTSWMERLKTEIGKASAVTETAAILTASIPFSGQTWVDLKELQKEAPAHQIKLRVEDAASGDGHDLLDDAFNEAAVRNHRLVCTKAPISRVLRFFFAASLRDLVTREPSAVEAVSKIFIADLPASIVTAGVEIEVWEDQIDFAHGKPLFKSPREFINDATGEAVVPQSVRQWIADLDDSNHTALFGAGYSRRLALVMPTSIVRGANGNLVALSDLKRKTASEIEPADHEIWDDYDLTKSLLTATRWVFLGGPDIENRHTILASEIARSFPKSSTWGEGLKSAIENAFDSAKIAYRLHLYDKSIDALKLMSDLRKGLSDDVKSVSSQTSALSAGLWRDAAVAVGAVALKPLSGDAGPLILIVVAAYLIVSWYLNTRLATEAVDSIARNERVFRSKLYGPLLADDEYKEIAGDRYAEVLNDFKSYKKVVSWVYWCSILFVCMFAAWPHMNEFKTIGSCVENHLTHFADRAFKPDAIPFAPSDCLFRG